jgi:PleD family two-component response regulator
MNWDTARNRIWTERRVRAAGTRLRVLVVDDNQNAADALAMYLHLEDLDIRTAYGGKQAVEVAMTWTPHLIVMDISMPGCTGFEAALVIRRDTKRVISRSLHLPRWTRLKCDVTSWITSLMPIAKKVGRPANSLHC